MLFSNRHCFSLQTPPPSPPSSTRPGRKRGSSHSHFSPSDYIFSSTVPAQAPAAGATRARALASGPTADPLATACKTNKEGRQKAMRDRAAEVRGSGGRCLCLPYPSHTSSGLFAASAEPDADTFSIYRAVAQLRRPPSFTGYTASCYSGSFRPSSGSEPHLHTVNLSWTVLFAAIGGPSDNYTYFAYFASPGTGSKLRRIDSAGYFRTAPSASMAGGVRLLDRS
jgi:hypothetical protein